MSWATCYSGSNNIHFDYPALMSDGRQTDWNPSCDMNNKYISQNNITNNYQYRQFLINNGNTIRMNNNKLACDNCGVCNYGHKFTPNSSGKYLFKNCGDKAQPYGYECSDLKNAYLSREELQSRMIAPLLSQQGYLHLPNSK